MHAYLPFLLSPVHRVPCLFTLMFMEEETGLGSVILLRPIMKVVCRLSSRRLTGTIEVEGGPGLNRAISPASCAPSFACLLLPCRPRSASTLQHRHSLVYSLCSGHPTFSLFFTCTTQLSRDIARHHPPSPPSPFLPLVADPLHNATCSLRNRVL